MRQQVLSGISPRFRGLSRSGGQVTHVLLTRSPLEYPRRGLSARLACVKHAASVRPEPGSNSPTKTGKPKPGKQKCQTHQPAENPPTSRHKKPGTGLSDTLLSSQRPITHQKPPRKSRQAPGAQPHPPRHRNRRFYHPSSPPEPCQTIHPDLTHFA